ncbi:MAG: sugar ABC transporter substrate-binding protein [Eubacteriales bacterium]|nr:sugar ABC transporter substrate-binding protein [Eubacteriales bacterium]
MKKKRIFVFLLLMLLIGILSFAALSENVEKREPRLYSVILYQYTDNDWTSLLEGIRQAAEDENAVINYVTLPVGGLAEDEIKLLWREIENGAEGILLAPMDSAALSEAVREASKAIPIITLETGLEDEEADISADNYSMGHMLGSRVAEEMIQNQEDSVCVIEEYMERQSIQRRYQGFVDAIREALPNAQVTGYHRQEGDYNLPVCIANLYATGRSGVYVAALDKYCTEALIEASEASVLSKAQAELFRQRAFGIGNTEKIVGGLDAGALRGLVYQNEFSMGYQGLEALIQKKQKRTAQISVEIKAYYVTRDTLYKAENQRLLFPLI